MVFVAMDAADSTTLRRYRERRAVPQHRRRDDLEWQPGEHGTARADRHRVYSRADNADVVYATVANFGNHHIFRSADGGLNWVDVDRGDLPDAPLLSMALPAAHPDRVYVCGDAGVFSSDDEGATWTNLTGNLPNVTVVDLVYHEEDRTLTAATYGRSIWRRPVD